jgi:protocatechuate 3,4-dioxygenase beta subunit
MPDAPKPPDQPSSRIDPTTLATTGMSRRSLLTGFGGTGLMVAGASTAGPATASATTTIAAETVAEPRPLAPNCTLAREVTEGPYYLDLLAVRRDITEGTPGVPLTLRTTVVDSTTCQPIPNAAVDVWHCDASGQYSAFQSQTQRTYLRGVQLSDATGVAEFRTIYPGWYPGRAVHIHIKVHIGGRVSGNTYVGGEVVHTGQLYFDDAVSDQVMRLQPYAAHTGWRLPNVLDLIFWQGGGSGLLTLRPVNPPSPAEGVIGTAVLGVEPES